MPRSRGEAAQPAGDDDSPGSARAFSSATITFGLVTVPVRLMAATCPSAGISFHLLHAKDKARVRQQLLCSEEGKVVSRDDLVKGYEYAKGEYVVFEPEELKALDQVATRGIEVTEFVPRDTLDPIFFEKTYYLSQNVSPAFDPAKYQDQVRRRILKAIEAKVEGGEVAAPPARERAPGKVVDLMEVLKKSLRQPTPSKARGAPSRTRVHSRRRAAS